jgi:hypothetical protein
MVRPLTNSGLDRSELQACNSLLRTSFPRGMRQELANGASTLCRFNPQPRTPQSPRQAQQSHSHQAKIWNSLGRSAHYALRLTQRHSSQKKAAPLAKQRVCLSCDVRAECLEYALAHDERFGIWGGLSERERRRLKRRTA